jgi:type II secretory pathway component PulJ
MIVAVVLSALVLFYGMRFAPEISTQELATSN